MGYIDAAVSWAVQIANDGSYAYVWGGWGKSDGGYDCGHFVIDAYTKAGIDIKGAGASFTGDMPKAFMQCGFQNVTGSVNLSTGAGMRKGDVLVNSAKHAALVQRDGGITVEALCKKNGIVCDKAYRNDGWDYVLRYTENSDNGGLKPQREEVISVPSGLGKYYTYMNWNTVTNMDTAQGRLIQAAGKHYDSNGYGIVGNRYALAMTSTFGKIGDYVDVYMSDGRVIHGILADEKSQVYCSWDHNPANKWGHDNGQCIVEWVTNWKGHDNPPSNGSVLKVVNLGNYFEYPEYASSTESYMYSANAYGDEKEAVVVWNNRVKENIHKRLQDLPPIPPQEKLTLFANGKDITEIAGNLAWKNSLYELATYMSFETAKTDAAYLKDLIYVPQVGDIIRMATNAEIFRGVITEVDDGDKDCNKYTIHDLGWYLNKTTQTYQFKNITAADAIKELNQYYIEKSHDYIIEPSEWELVQLEMERRSKIGKVYSNTDIFAARLKCECCGGFYGKKVWHSTDKYRREIWQCNSKFNNKKKCDTPHLTTDEIKSLFLRAYSEFVGDRENIIEDCELLCHRCTDTTKLQEQLETETAKANMYADTTAKLIQENASRSMNQDAYNKRYEDLVQKYERSISRCGKIEKEISERKGKETKIRLFIDRLKVSPNVLEEWDDTVWIGFIDEATVHKDCGITFKFKNGAEITV